MEYNFVASGIELIATTIKKMSVENSIGNLEREAKRSLGMNISEPHIEKMENCLLAQLTIDFEIVIDQAENQKLKIKMSIEGDFLSDEGAEEKKFKQLVGVNGAAAIIGIARGKIEAITANIFNDGKVVLPFVNVIDYYKSLAE